MLLSPPLTSPLFPLPVLCPSIHCSLLLALPSLVTYELCHSASASVFWSSLVPPLPLFFFSSSSTPCGVFQPCLSPASRLRSCPRRVRPGSTLESVFALGGAQPDRAGRIDPNTDSVDTKVSVGTGSIPT